MLTWLVGVRDGWRAEAFFGGQRGGGRITRAGRFPDRRLASGAAAGEAAAAAAAAQGTGGGALSVGDSDAQDRVGGAGRRCTTVTAAALRRCKLRGSKAHQGRRAGAGSGIVTERGVSLVGAAEGVRGGEVQPGPGDRGAGGMQGRPARFGAPDADA